MSGRRGEGSGHERPVAIRGPMQHTNHALWEQYGLDDMQDSLMLVYTRKFLGIVLAEGLADEDQIHNSTSRSYLGGTLPRGEIPVRQGPALASNGMTSELLKSGSRPAGRNTDRSVGDFFHR